MNSETVNSAGGGIGFLGLLGILFIGLKLTGYINWSWWFVLMPLYGPIALAVAIALVVVIGIILFELVAYFWKKFVKK